MRELLGLTYYRLGRWSDAVRELEAFRTANIEQASLFNFTPYLALSAIYLVITLPLTRLTDYLVVRDRRRFLAGAR